MARVLSLLCIVFCLASCWTDRPSTDPHLRIFRTGSPSDTITFPRGGICLMGGGPEDDEAMRWFLHRASGGDILVLRASGSDGYNAYLQEELGVPVHSVTTIVCQDRQASFDERLLGHARSCEGIWFAGGDQWKYVQYWQDTPLMDIISRRIQEDHLVVGGTSAGMVIQGDVLFSAAHGTIQSTEALASLDNDKMTIDTNGLLHHKLLKSVLMDTHYSQRDRQGRHLAFMACLHGLQIEQPRGIGCDESMALCIDQMGLGKIYGPEDAAVYFLQEQAGASAPTSISPLHWQEPDGVVQVSIIRGKPSRIPTFNLLTWTGESASLEYWSALEGKLVRTPYQSD
ncbi:MAG: cyanophycinase [Saprospiraceae bacterium]|nr:cyanophycinase [Saprospiraceae bacterium]